MLAKFQRFKRKVDIVVTKGSRDTTNDEIKGVRTKSRACASSHNFLKKTQVFPSMWLINTRTMRPSGLVQPIFGLPKQSCKKIYFYMLIRFLKNYICFLKLKFQFLVTVCDKIDIFVTMLWLFIYILFYYYIVFVSILKKYLYQKKYFLCSN